MKKMNLGGASATTPVQSEAAIVTCATVREVPELDVLLAFAKPSVVAAGLVCLCGRIELYHALEGAIRMSYVERSNTFTPSASIQQLLKHLSIERGTSFDGKGLEGKIVDLTEPSSAVNLHDAYPELQVGANETLFNYNDILRFVAKRYPGDKWGV